MVDASSSDGRYRAFGSEAAAAVPRRGMMAEKGMCGEWGVAGVRGEPGRAEWLIVERVRGPRVSTPPTGSRFGLENVGGVTAGNESCESDTDVFPSIDRGGEGMVGGCWSTGLRRRGERSEVRRRVPVRGAVRGVVNEANT